MKILFIIATALVFFNDSLQNIQQNTNTHAVLVTSNTTLEIFDVQHHDYSIDYKILIKNKFALDHARIYIHYNNFKKIKSAHVTARDVLGNVLEKYKLKDFEDVALDYSSMFSDSRFKILRVQEFSYPFELEVSYQISNKATLYYDEWKPQSPRMQVKNAQLLVKDYTKNNLRYSSNLILDPEIEETETFTSYHWILNDLESKKHETYNNNKDELFPVVYLAPKKFLMDGYAGSFESWQSFGKWIESLNKNRQDLSVVDLKELQSKGLQKDSKIETIKSVYQYLQETTRYISIQVGIGGYQPFNTSYVHQNKFGDCKALSFYTKSILDFFNIKSYYTLINAGMFKNDILHDFPNAGFNHVILTVPVAQDTLFLECTSQSNPFGYTGTFTGNRSALLINGDQSRIIKTKHYSANDNTQLTNARISLNTANGSSRVFLEKEFKGTQIEYADFINQYQQGRQEFKNWVTDVFEFDGLVKIDSLSLKPLESGVIPKGGMSLTMKNPKEAVKRGDRIFISPKKYMNSSPKMPKEKMRQTKVSIRFGYQDIDSIVYVLENKNYFIENDPQSVLLKTRFGIYERETRQEKNKIIIKRIFTLYGKEHSANEFQEFKSFIKKVRKFDNQKIVLLMR